MAPRSHTIRILRLAGRSAAAVVLLGAASSGAAAQSRIRVANETFAGSELESYLRNLQLTGAVPLYPWSVRGFSPAEIARLAPTSSAHPWAARYSFTADSAGRSWELLRPSTTLGYNSSYPYGGNDGPVWAGRGLTASLQMGVSARRGIFSARLAPIAFIAQNQAFALTPNGHPGDSALWDPAFPDNIDLPQRFGTSSYGRVDWGESFARVDVRGVAAGVSTASQWLGPTAQFPYVLGNNAGGFPHVFLGTAQPADIWIATIQARVFWGTLQQSPYSPVTGPDRFTSVAEPGRTRLASGLVLSVQPRGVPGLEFGAARFFESINDGSALGQENLRRPFQGILKKNLPKRPGLLDLQGGEDNQLASAFFRWVLPRSGFELYGEYGKEDHNYDTRDLVLEPDHARTYALGFRRSFRTDSARMTVFSAEVFSAALSPLAKNRGEGEIYIHSLIRQGHTQRGQLLGADIGPGAGSAARIALDRYARNGRLSAFLSRRVARPSGTFYQTGQVTRGAPGLSYAAGAEGVRFGARADWTARAYVSRMGKSGFAAAPWGVSAQVGMAVRVR